MCAFGIYIPYNTMKFTYGSIFIPLYSNLYRNSQSMVAENHCLLDANEKKTVHIVTYY